MIKRIIGGLLLASPYIAITLLPLYTDTPWWVIGLAYSITMGVALVVFLGIKLLEG